MIAAPTWFRLWMVWAVALVMCLAAIGLQQLTIARKNAELEACRADYRQLSMMAERQSAAVDDLARQAAAKQAAAAKAARQAAQQVQRYQEQAEALRAATPAGDASCAAAVATVREGMR